MAKKCPGCGVTTRSVRAKYCSNCGTKFERSAAGSVVRETREFVSGAAEEAAAQLKDAARHPASKKIAGAAAIGGVAGALLPVVTVGVGAALLGGFVAYKQLTKK
jgi:hypothetical protein